MEQGGHVGHGVQVDGFDEFGGANLAAVASAAAFAAGFDLAQGDVVITAVRATLVIDAEADTFAFDLEDVTYVRAAETRPGDPPADGTFERLDSHLLGPAPWGRDIVPGAARPRPDKVTPPPARPRDRMREDADEPTRTRPERDRDDGGGVSGLIGG